MVTESGNKKITPESVGMSVEIAGITLKNPVITPSGTCGYGRDYLDFWSPEQLGAIAVKAVSVKPRDGNPPPRIAEIPSGVLNSIGLENPGVHKFISDELPWLKSIGATVIANVVGYTDDDYAECVGILDGTGVDMIELNISCPNVKGTPISASAERTEALTKRIKGVTKKPVIVKLSPNVTSITDIAKAAEAGGADALSLINTVMGMRINIKTRRPMLKNITGGMSGPAVFPLAVRMVWQTSNAVNIPIIGGGGITTAEDAVEMMMAGADAVSCGTAMFSDPSAPLKIIEGLRRWCSDNGVGSVRELTGSVVTG